MNYWDLAFPIYMILSFAVLLVLIIDKMNGYPICQFMYKILWFIWEMIKSMKTIRGALSLLIAWLLLSGAGLILVGLILQTKVLVSIGVVIYAFWLGPFTPLLPLMIGLALLIQRFVFQDRSFNYDEVRAKIDSVRK